MGLKGGISIDADSGPPRHVLWCCGGICHELLTFIQIGCGHTVEHLILYLKIQFDLIFLVSHNVQDSTKKSAIFSRLDKKQDSSSPLTKIKVTLDDSKIARSVNTIRNHPDDQMESSRNLLKRPAPNSGIVFCCYNCLHLTFLVFPPVLQSWKKIVEIRDR